MDNPFIMFISIILGTILGHATADWLLKDKDMEWHNAKDETPDNENDILCQISKDEVEVGYYHTKQKRYYTIDGQPIDVIRWQKIVFPKGSE